MHTSPKFEDFKKNAKLAGQVLIRDALKFDLFKQASAMAYVTLLSLVPSLTVVFVLTSLFTPFLSEGSKTITTIQNFILQNLTSASGAQVGDYLKKLIGSLSLAKVGIAGFSGFLVSLIFLLRNIEIVFNRIWMVDKKRSIFVRFIYFWTFLTLGFFMITLVVGLITGIKWNSAIGREAVPDDLYDFGVYLFKSTMAFLAFLFLYRLVPNTKVTMRAASIGGLSSAIIFQGVSQAFAVYVKSVASFKTIYGTLAVLPLFLIWLYVCWIVILLGGVIAWRADQDWPPNPNEEESGIDPKDPFKSMRLRSLAPLFVLVVIYKHFAEGHGRALRGSEIKARFGLPSRWIKESLQYLVQQNLILVAFESSDSEAESYLLHRFFPAYPLEGLSLTDVTKSIAEPIGDWMSDFSHKIPKDYLEILDFIVRSPVADRAKLTIKDCFQVGVERTRNKN